MQQTYYIPIYSWGDNPDTTNGTSYGTVTYLNLNDLYGFEPDSVGYIEFTAKIPTENEFKEKLKIESGNI